MTARGRGGVRPKRAALILLSADPAVRDEVGAELRSRYGVDYHVVVGATPAEAAAELPDETVIALVLAGYSGSDPAGLEVVNQVAVDDQQAIRAVVVRWGELDIAESIFATVAAGQLDAWVFRPQAAADEEFHLAVTELLHEWANRSGASAEAVQVIGERWSKRSTELRDIFLRNRVPAGFYDAAEPRGQELLASLGLTDPALPVVVLRFRPTSPC